MEISYKILILQNENPINSPNVPLMYYKNVVIVIMELWWNIGIVYCIISS